jgi:hypothetical protein
VSVTTKPAEAGTPADKPAEAKKRTLWETVITSTPVLLTILATLLAGMSSSNMTRSMYFRSVAAQNESKGGNQWAFFQAKRIRGTTLEMTLATLGARPEGRRFSFAGFEKDAAAQAREYKTAQKEAERLVAALKSLPAGKAARSPEVEAALGLALLGQPAAPLVGAPVLAQAPVGEAANPGAEARKLQELVEKLAREAAEFPGKIKKAGDKPFSEDDLKKLEVADTPIKKIADAYPFLDGAAPLPYLAEEKKDVDEENAKREEKKEKKLRLTVLDALKVAEERINPTIPAVVQAILDRKHEAEIAKMMKDGAKDQGGRSMKKKGDEEVHKAVDLAEERGQKFDQLDGVLGDAGKAFRNLVGEEEKRAQDFHKAAKQAQEALYGLKQSPEADGKPDLAEAHTAAAALVAHSERLLTAAREQSLAYRTALIDYDARRYRREAEYNQGIGYLRDVQSKLAEMHSDDYLQASYMLFYCMLAAQAGVTIATFSLAVRQKSFLWALATAAGAGALVAAGSVLVGMMF